MNILNKITKIVAGKLLVAEVEERRLRREHERKGTEESLRRVSDTNPEPQLPQPKCTDLRRCAHSKTINKPEFFNPFARVNPRVELFLRAKEEIKAAAEAEPKTLTPSNPIDDTHARDLTPEEHEATYRPDGYDPAQHSLPPLIPCVGIGKYAVPVNADPEFLHAKLKKNLAYFPPEIVEQLVQTKLSEAHPAAWRRVLDEQASRGYNTASSNCFQPGPSQDFEADYIDPVTGTHVVRGFRPSASALASVASMRQGHSFVRKDSGLSLGSTVGPTSFRFNKRPIRNRSVLKKKQNTSRKKIERPCFFDEGSDIDTAVASVDNFEREWIDVIEHAGNKCHSTLSKVVEDAEPTEIQSQPSGNLPRVVQTPAESIDQAWTRAFVQVAGDMTIDIRDIRPQFLQGQSRHTPAGDKAPDKTANQPSETGQIKIYPSDASTTSFIASFTKTPQTPATDSDSIGTGPEPPTSELWMNDTILVQKERAMTKDSEPFPTQDSSGNTLVPKGAEPGREGKGRARSATAIRIPRVADSEVKDGEHAKKGD